MTSFILSLVLFAISCMSILPCGEMSFSEVGFTSNSQRFKLSITLLHRSPSEKCNFIDLVD